jgi:acetolactate synthase-1/3 small subunit
MKDKIEKSDEPMRHTLSVLVENKAGVLARVAGLFSGRGFNIASLSVGETTDPDVSRMTIVVEGDYQTLEQCVKQLDKLVVTIEVEDFVDRPYVSSELMVIKVDVGPEERSEVMDVSSVFKGRVVDITNESMTIRFVGQEDVINDIIELLRPYGIEEIARTGSVALARGEGSQQT